MHQGSLEILLEASSNSGAIVYSAANTATRIRQGLVVPNYQIIDFQKKTVISYGVRKTGVESI